MTPVVKASRTWQTGPNRSVLVACGSLIQRQRAHVVCYHAEKSHSHHGFRYWRERRPFATGIDKRIQRRLIWYPDSIYQVRGCVWDDTMQMQGRRGRKKDGASQCLQTSSLEHTTTPQKGDYTIAITHLFKEYCRSVTRAPESLNWKNIQSVFLHQDLRR